MIFILAKELCDHEAWTFSELCAIEKLAHSVFHGAHIVVAESAPSVTKLMNSDALAFGPLVKAVFKKIISEFSFQGALRKLELKQALVTTPEHRGAAESRCESVLTLDDISKISLDPLTLLTENLVDAKSYAYAARHYIISQRLKNIEVNIIERGGGGSTIAAEFEEIATRRDRICFAVTDSDKSAPGVGESSTSKKCAQSAARSPVIAGHFAITVREVENLVPPQVLVELPPFDDDPEAIYEYRARCEISPEIRIYGDVKGGTVGSRIFRLPVDSAERRFLEEQLAKVRGNNCRCLVEEDCRLERNGKACECICIPRMGAVAEHFHTWLSTRSAHSSLKNFDGAWREHWIEIGKAVVAWGCANPRMRD